MRKTINTFQVVCFFFICAIAISIYYTVGKGVSQWLPLIVVGLIFIAAFFLPFFQKRKEGEHAFQGEGGQESPPWSFFKSTFSALSGFITFFFAQVEKMCTWAAIYAEETEGRSTEAGSIGRFFVLLLPLVIDVGLIWLSLWLALLFGYWFTWLILGALTLFLLVIFLGYLYALLRNWKAFLSNHYNWALIATFCQKGIGYMMSNWVLYLISFLFWMFYLLVILPRQSVKVSSWWIHVALLGVSFLLLAWFNYARSQKVAEQSSEARRAVFASLSGAVLLVAGVFGVIKYALHSGSFTILRSDILWAYPLGMGAQLLTMFIFVAYSLGAGGALMSIFFDRDSALQKIWEYARWSVLAAILAWGLFFLQPFTKTSITPWVYLGVQVWMTLALSLQWWAKKASVTLFFDRHSDNATIRDHGTEISEATGSNLGTRTYIRKSDTVVLSETMEVDIRSLKRRLETDLTDSINETDIRRHNDAVYEVRVGRFQKGLWFLLLSAGFSFGALGVLSLIKGWELVYRAATSDLVYVLSLFVLIFCILAMLAAKSISSLKKQITTLPSEKKKDTDLSKEDILKPKDHFSAIRDLQKSLRDEGRKGLGFLSRIWIWAFNLFSMIFGKVIHALEWTWVFAVGYVFVYFISFIPYNGWTWWAQGRSFISQWNFTILLWLTLFSFLAFFNRFSELRLIRLRKKLFGKVDNKKRASSVTGDHHNIDGWTQMWITRGSDYCKEKAIKYGIFFQDDCTEEDWRGLFDVYRYQIEPFFFKRKEWKVVWTSCTNFIQQALAHELEFQAEFPVSVETWMGFYESHANKRLSSKTEQIPDCVETDAINAYRRVRTFSLGFLFVLGVPFISPAWIYLASLNSTQAVVKKSSSQSSANMSTVLQAVSLAQQSIRKKFSALRGRIKAINAKLLLSTRRSKGKDQAFKKLHTGYMRLQEKMRKKISLIASLKRKLRTKRLASQRRRHLRRKDRRRRRRRRSRNIENSLW